MSTVCRSREEMLALFDANRSLAFKCLNELRRRYTAVRRMGGDREQLALMALWSCAQHFDPSLGYQLSGYVYTAVRRKLLSTGLRQEAAAAQLHRRRIRPGQPA